MPNSQSLHALVLKLTAQNQGTLHSTVGELAHAAFYAAIQAADAELAQRLHDAPSRKGFALSPLYGYWQSPADQRFHINPGQPGWLRVSLLDDELFGTLMRHLMTLRQPTIRIGEVHLAIGEVLGTPGSHPWVGYTTVEQLRALEETPRRWSLEFASPTAIRWGQADDGTRRVELFPQPRPAIASLRSRWDRLAGEQWGKEFEEWVERNIVVGRVRRWQTEPIRYKKNTYVGGVGELDYHLLDKSNSTSSRTNIAHFNRLLHLAFYAGIGYKTTHGLGQVRIES